MSRIFITSDTHFGHQNIIKYCNRPYKSVKEMNDDMIKKWNNTVSKNDKVFHLGDIGFGEPHELYEIIHQLNGYKILIRGNHDKAFSDSTLKTFGFKEIYKYPIVLEEEYILSHYKLQLVLGSDMKNIFGHSHNKDNFNNGNYYNACVENNNYKPKMFHDIKLNFKKYTL